MAKKRSTKARSIRTETVDLAALRQRPDFADIQTDISAFGEGGEQGRAGAKLAKVLQFWHDKYLYKGQITPAQWQGAEDWYRDWIDAQGGNPAWDGVFVENSGAKTISQRQMDAYCKFKLAEASIGHETAMNVTSRVVLGNKSVNQAALIEKLKYRDAWQWLRNGLDDLARHHNYLS